MEKKPEKVNKTELFVIRVEETIYDFFNEEAAGRRPAVPTVYVIREALYQYMDSKKRKKGA